MWDGTSDCEVNWKHSVDQGFLSFADTHCSGKMIAIISCEWNERDLGDKKLKIIFFHVVLER